MLKYECEDPDGEWHDHGACVTQQLIVSAYYSRAQTLQDKLAVVAELYSSLVYWNHRIAETFLGTELGDKFENLGDQAEVHRHFISNLMYKEMGELFHEQHEKAQNECSLHGTKWAQSCLRCKHAQRWLKAMNGDVVNGDNSQSVGGTS